MGYIDEKFKDQKPEDTVARIQKILNDIGIEVEEKWNDSGIENCCSLNVAAKGGAPASNGKGISKEFARASAYAEFIERIQGGLSFYKYQSILRNKKIDIHSYAPDVKYMTVEELAQTSDWMDILIDKYNLSLTRKDIAEQCKIYACADDGKILTLPFYSLFEDKYVYLPMGFVDQIYATNGCCAGNNREEAWVHAFSEMMERHASLKMLISGKSAPKIPYETLSKFPTVKKIIDTIKQTGKFDIEVFDYSLDNGFPVISTRIINKQNQSYKTNVAADPVLEIAIQRTLTETFQGRTIKNFTSTHKGKILANVSDFPIKKNVINQLETSSGIFTADFFANEITCDKKVTEFEDRSHKSNKELLDYMVGLYRDLNLPVYVRNFSFLDFPSYRFIVPGFSEAVALKLSEPISEYAIADGVSKTLRDIGSADFGGLNWFRMYDSMVSNIFGRYTSFDRLAGLPISGEMTSLLFIYRAYTAYKLGQYNDAIKHIDTIKKFDSVDEELKGYFKCVQLYLTLKRDKVTDEKIKLIISKFFEKRYVERFYSNLSAGSPFEEFLFKCDYNNCSECKYCERCSYKSIEELMQNIGKIYKSFIDGQSKEQFAI